jgi:hypothetical protein
MYRLYKDSDGLNLLAKYFQSHIQGLGKILGSRAEQEVTWIRKVSPLLSNHICKCFKTRSGICFARVKASSFFPNSKGCVGIQKRSEES